MKPQNLLVLAAAPIWWIKISDFGISKRVEFTPPRTIIGTDAYLAPEVKGIYTLDSDEADENNFSLAVDIWSVGAIAYRITTGLYAFPERRKLYSYVVKGGPFTVEGGISSELTEFIKETMAPSPKQRPAANQAYEHLWLQTARLRLENKLQIEAALVGISQEKDENLSNKIQLPTPRSDSTANYQTWASNSTLEMNINLGSARKLVSSNGFPQIRTVKFLYEGKMLASNDLRRMVTWWDRGQKSTMYSIFSAPEGSDYWKLIRGEPEELGMYLKGEAPGIHALSGDGKHLAFLRWNRTHVWEDLKGDGMFDSCPSGLTEPPPKVFSLSISFHGRLLGFSCRDRLVVVGKEGWNQDRFGRPQTILSYENQGWSAEGEFLFSDDETQIFTFHQGEIAVWKKGPLTPFFQSINVLKLDEDPQMISSSRMVHLSPDARVLTLGTNDSIRSVDVCPAGLTPHPSSFDISSPNHRVFVSRTGDRCVTFPGPERRGGGDLRFGKRSATGTWRLINVVEVETGFPSMAMSPDGSFILAVDMLMKVCIWKENDYGRYERIFEHQPEHDFRSHQLEEHVRGARCHIISRDHWAVMLKRSEFF